LKTGGGANISLSALENELIKLNYNVIPVMGINVKDALSFCKLSHISFNPLLKFTCKEIIKNWQDAFILLNYCLKTSQGLKRIKDPNSLIINNGHWCFNSDVLVIRFLMKSYLNHLKGLNYITPWYLSLLDLKKKIILFVENKIIKDTNIKKIITLSDKSKDDFNDCYPGLSSKVVVIPNGVNKDVFRFSVKDRLKTRKLLGINKKHPVILFVGGNIYRKNFELVIKVFKNLPSDIHLLAIIRREELDKAKEFSKGFGNITFLPWQDNPSMYYNASDILIAPTIYDTGTKVILEALVNGLYCLVSDSSGVGEFIGNGEGKIIVGSNSRKYYSEIRNRGVRGVVRKIQPGRLVLSWSEVGVMWNRLLSSL